LAQQRFLWHRCGRQRCGRQRFIRLPQLGSQPQLISAPQPQPPNIWNASALDDSASSTRPQPSIAGKRTRLFMGGLLESIDAGYQRTTVGLPTPQVMFVVRRIEAVA
jgi:hypothetical protein